MMMHDLSFTDGTRSMKDCISLDNSGLREEEDEILIIVGNW